MSETDYHVLAILPPSPEFSIAEAIGKLSGGGYLVQSQTGPNGEGIRMELDDGWGLVAWLEENDDALETIHAIQGLDIPHGESAVQLSDCKQLLSVWSDDDSDFMNGVLFEEMIQHLANELGALIFDNRLGEWR